MKAFIKLKTAFLAMLTLLFAPAVFAAPCDNWSGTNPVYYLDGSVCRVYACPGDHSVGTTDMSYCTGSSSGGGSSSTACTAGQTQNKYTASGCSYTTSTRTCCNDKTWSDWDKACSGSSSCTSSQCWNSSTSSCESKPSGSCTCTNGSCNRSYKCGSSGWTYTDGPCTCYSGYEKNSSGTCVKECKSGSRTIQTVQQNCAAAEDGYACAASVFNNAKTTAKFVTSEAACSSTRTSSCYEKINSGEAWDTKYPPTGGHTTHVNVACYSSTCIVSGSYVCPK